MLLRALRARPLCVASRPLPEIRSSFGLRYFPAQTLGAGGRVAGCNRFFSGTPESQRFSNVSSAFTPQKFPAFVHAWGRRPFMITGAGMTAAASYALFAGHNPIWMVLVAGYWIRGYWDINSEDSILANFPVIGWGRYICQDLRGEIHQYFIETDKSGRPFNILQRSTVYQRAKNNNDTSAFGTVENVYEEGYEYLTHTLWPKKVKEESLRFTIGANSCREPYSASRLNISAMSYGALSQNAILALNKGCAYGDFYHNTGEGAISDHHLEPGGDLVWNIGTGYFGCRTADGGFDEKLFSEKAVLPSVKMIEVKLSQGAKPAHGGMLPGSKITPEIARIRNVPMGQDVHSPPTHSAFNTPRELMHFMDKLRKISGKPVGFKLCVGQPTETMALIRAAQETGLPPDFITVDGGEGGTGAAPKEFTNSVGMPMRGGLTFVHDALVGAGIRHKVTLIVSGKIVTGKDMIRAFAMGADVCNAARSFLFALGCIQALQCNTNKCPTGITTQDPALVAGLVVDSKWQRVYLYHKNTMKNMAEVVGATGVDNPSNVRRENYVRRVKQDELRTYLQIYPREAPGALLENKGMALNQDYWDDAGLLLDQLDGKEITREGKVGPPYLTELPPYMAWAEQQEKKQQARV